MGSYLSGSSESAALGLCCMGMWGHCAAGLAGLQRLLGSHHCGASRAKSGSPHANQESDVCMVRGRDRREERRESGVLVS